MKLTFDVPAEMEELFDIALSSVMAKFPEEFHNPKYKFEVFDLVEMICKELMHKHLYPLIVASFLMSLGEVKDE